MSEILHAEKLNALYNGKKILQNTTIELKKGEIVCICGPNGAGKSTLLNLFSGNIPEGFKWNSYDLLPSIDNNSVFSIKKKDLAKKVAVMLQQETSIWNYSVFDMVLSGRFPYTINGFYSKDDKTVADNIINELNLTNIRNREIHSLSGGEYQKVRIARALCQSSDFILLDEPGNNLDFVYEQSFLLQLQNIAHKKNIGIAVTVHDINIAAKYAEKMLLMPINGFSIFGKTTDVLTIDNLNLIYGANFICQKTNSFQLSQ